MILHNQLCGLCRQTTQVVKVKSTMGGYIRVTMVCEGCMEKLIEEFAAYRQAKLRDVQVDEPDSVKK